MKGSQVQNGHHPTWESGFRLGKCSKAGTAERLDQMENNRETVAMSTAIKKNAEWPRALLLLLAGGCGVIPGPVAAQDDAKTKQLRLLCAQLSGDLTEPGGMAAFQRCLTTHNPAEEIRRDNNVGSN